MAGNWWSELPLAINLIGPMAFQQNGDYLEIWMPNLDNPKYPHQAGIETDRDSFILGDESEYWFSDPNPKQYSGGTLAYNPSPSIPYVIEAYPSKPYYIHLKLPRPKWIVGLDPVSCKIQYGAQGDQKFHTRPVGFRLLYEKAGTPAVISRKGSHPVSFDPAPDEKQIEMSIKYYPYNYETYGHAEAADDFAKIGAMLGVVLKVEYEFPFQLRADDNPHIDNGPVNDCKAPTVILI